MKNINPIGRESRAISMSAFGCMCNETVMKDTAAVKGNVPCNVCAYSCEPGNSANSQANYNASF